MYALMRVNLQPINSVLMLPVCLQRPLSLFESLVCIAYSSGIYLCTVDRLLSLSDLFSILDYHPSVKRCIL